MSLSQNLSALFSLKASPNIAQSSSINGLNEENRRQGETYTAYGSRMCGKTAGATTALGPMLQKVFNSEKQAQINDSNLQKSKRNEINDKISQLAQQIIDVDADKQSAQSKITDLERCISETTVELSQAENENGQINKPAQMKLYLGLIILSILTLYLFVFYSSTFYSAFFKDFLNSDLSIGEAMFDAQAIPNALKNGFGEFLFIMCAPIIFLGLGFSLHFFSEQKGIAKYFKMTSIIAITFIFDCILAYLIAKNIYDVNALNSINDVEEFNFSMAVHDVNVWAVIFCGFIVYIIWGIVFDMTMSAYNELRSNKHIIKQLKSRINLLQKQKQDENQRIIEFDKQKSILESKKSSLELKMNNNIFYDPHAIKMCLSDFFAGWVTLMTALGLNKDTQEEAKTIYDSTIATFFPN